MQALRSIVLGLLVLGWAGAAAADGVPLGRWASAAGNVFMVNDNATCAYVTSTTRVEGSCSWQGGAKDGVIAIDYQAAGQTVLQRMYVSIHWNNNGTITVFGEMFRRR